jgi:hypothetical protein
MELFKEYQIATILENACEDIHVAFQERALPSFSNFPKTRRAELEQMVMDDRENMSMYAAEFICNQSGLVVEKLADFSEAPVLGLAEILAELLRYATKEDKRIVAAILKEVLP